MEKTINLVIVSYLNTLPFIKGIESKKEHPFNLKFAKPSECASYFLQNKCDIALIPVGALPHAEDYSIITNFCIGCDGNVRTVCIMSKSEIEKIDTIYLDEDSRTSVLLCKILMKEYWKRKKIKYIEGLPIDFQSLMENEALLAIGDKVFENEGKLPFNYDLGFYWKKFTNLPFAFAVFVARPNLEDGVSNMLNEMLKFGVDNIKDLDLSQYENITNIKDYFNENISYTFDKEKWIALKQFIEYSKLL